MVVRRSRQDVPISCRLLQILAEISPFLVFLFWLGRQNLFSDVHPQIEVLGQHCICFYLLQIEFVVSPALCLAKLLPKLSLFALLPRDSLCLLLRTASCMMKASDHHRWWLNCSVGRHHITWTSCCISHYLFEFFHFILHPTFYSFHSIFHTFLYWFLELFSWCSTSSFVFDPLRPHFLRQDFA